MRDNDEVSVGVILKWMIGTLVLLVLVIGGLNWFVQGNEFFLYKVFAPRQERVRREVFEQTPSFIQGTLQELQNLQLEYVKAEGGHKGALASIILQRAVAIPEDRMPADLRSFIDGLKRERGLAK